MDTLVLHQNTIQTRGTAIYHRLNIQAQTQKNRDEEIPDMRITIYTIESCTDIPGCMTAEEIRKVTLEDENLCALAEFTLCSGQSSKTEVQKRAAALLVIQR